VTEDEVRELNNTVLKIIRDSWPEHAANHALYARLRCGTDCADRMCGAPDCGNCYPTSKKPKPQEEP
jgi:hypothetical protein